MVEIINQLSQNWYEFYYWSTIQNSIFLIIIFGLLYLFKRSNVLLLKLLSITGLAKLLIPPIFEFKISEPIPIPIIDTITSQYIISASRSVSPAVELSPESMQMIVWFITVLLIISYMIGQYVKMIRSVKKTEKLDVTDLISSINQKRIVFHKSQNPISTYVIGFFNYKVILPKNWDNWSVGRKKMVLNHEMIHIRQKDPWINLLKVTVFALNFFNPLVWILINRLNHYSELVCDYMTMKSVGITSTDYSKELVKISADQRKEIMMSPATLAFSESFRIIKLRISHHLNNKEGSKMKITRNSGLIYLFFCCLLMVSFLWKCETNQPIDSMSIEDEKIYSGREVTELPQMLIYKEPIYPQEAIDQGIEGRVSIDVLIDEKGDVIQASVIEETSIPVLNTAALEAAKKCTFKPAEKDSVPVKIKRQIGFDFDLDFADPRTAKANNLYHFYDVPIKPIMTYKEPPAYPEEALNKGISGMAVLTVTINEEAHVEQAKVYKIGADPDPLLAKAALAVVDKCKFIPAMVDGNPVKVKMNIPYHFKLQ